MADLADPPPPTPPPMPAPALGLPPPSSTRILFGSCSKAQWPQPLWEPILERRPELWIWAGDNIYGDIEVQPHGFRPAPPERLRRLYAQQLANPGYQKLLNASVPIIATWDDHDFGLNDGDKRYPYRDGSQEAFLDFVGEPADSPRRQQRGVYTAKLFDFGGGLVAGRKVLVVMLDMRYHRDPYGTPDGDFLGPEQWAWLERTLAASAADVHLLVSSVQLLQGRKVLGRQIAGENWARFPGQRQRFLELLARLNVSSPIVLSGDVHFGELGLGVSQVGRLLEVTSSGLTHSWGTRQPSHGSPLVNLASHLGMALAMKVMPWNYQLLDGRGAQQYTLDLNFGELDFDWPARRVNVSLRGEQGRLHLHQAFALDDLGLRPVGARGLLELEPVKGEPSAARELLGAAICALAFLAPALLLCLAGGLLARRACRAAGLGRGASSDAEDDSGSYTSSDLDEPLDQDTALKRKCVE